MSVRQTSILVCGVAVAILAFGPGAGWSETVGSAAAVKPSSTGTPPGGNPRTLQSGIGIESKERIETGGSGSLQVMFLDKSTLTIGPNSNLLIDQFVYSPSTGTGQFAASLTRGALRFVGGQISHTAGVTIKTPVGTMGIRGGVGVATHDPQCGGNSCKGADCLCSRFACISGACTVTSNSGSTTNLGANQGLGIGPLGEIQTLNISAVNLNNISTTGTGGIKTTDSQDDGSSSSSSDTQSQQDAINEAARQQPAPAAPPPPAPGPGDPPPPPPPSP